LGPSHPRLFVGPTHLSFKTKICVNFTINFLQPLMIFWNWEEIRRQDGFKL
jgi:hypothetical protein